LKKFIFENLNNDASMTLFLLRILKGESIIQKDLNSKPIFEYIHVLHNMIEKYTFSNPYNSLYYDFMNTKLTIIEKKMLEELKNKKKRKEYNLKHVIYEPDKKIKHNAMLIEEEKFMEPPPPPIHKKHVGLMTIEEEEEEQPPTKNAGLPYANNINAYFTKVMNHFGYKGKVDTDFTLEKHRPTYESITAPLRKPADDYSFKCNIV
jgi:hypothetical protein